MLNSIIYALPSLTALLILSWLFLKTEKRNVLVNSPQLSILFVSLFSISFIEFTTFANLASASLTMMKLYYVAVFIGVLGILLSAIKFSIIKQKTKSIFIYSTTLSTTLISILMLTTKFFVAGFEFIGYSYTRIPGDNYWLVQLYFPLYVFTSLYLLFQSSKNTKNELNAKRARLLLYSLSPIMVCGVTVILLMSIGISINASIVFPVMTTLFLIILIHTENIESLFAVLLRIPYTKERIAYTKIKSEVQDFMLKTELSRAIDEDKKNSISLKKLTNSIERIIVDHTVELSEGSQIRAATLLGVSASSICRKKRKESMQI